MVGFLANISHKFSFGFHLLEKPRMGLSYFVRNDCNGVVICEHQINCCLVFSGPLVPIVTKKRKKKENYTVIARLNLYSTCQPNKALLLDVHSG